MTNDKSSKQAALPMGTTPAALDRGPVTVTFANDWADSIHEHARHLKALGAPHSPEDAARDLFNAGVAAYSWARDNLVVCTADHASDVPEASAVVAAPVEVSQPARTGAAIIGDVARKIADHTIAGGAGFWSGGVPEVRTALGVDADGQTIAAAFRRIERGQVAGVGATQCPQNHRAGGSYALWTVTVAPKKPAT